MTVLIAALGSIVAAGGAPPDNVGMRVTINSDGGSVTGLLRSLVAGEVVVETTDGMARVPAEALPIASFPDADTPATDPSWGRVWLRDGSDLPVTNVAILAGEQEVAFALPAEAVYGPPRCTVSIDAIESLLLPGADPAMRAQWEDLRRRAPAADLLVTTRRDAETLDYLEGFLESIEGDAVTVVLDGEPITAPRKKFYGVVFASVEDGANAPPRPVGPRIVTAAGMRLRSLDFGWTSEGALAVTTGAGLTLHPPLSQVVRVDYSAGRLTPLSALRPKSVRWRPLFGKPAAMASEDPSAAIRLDQAYWGGPLTLVEQPGVSPYPTEYASGLAIRSDAEVTYRLGKGYKQLRGVVGLDPATAGKRAVRLRIEVDGRPLLDETITPKSPTVPVRLSVEAAQALTLRVDRVDSLDATLNFGDARLTR